MPDLAKLEKALRDVLGPSFDDALRSLFDHERWYANSMPTSELFEHWVRDRVALASDQTWVFECVRAHERRLVCEKVGIERSKLVGKSPADAAAAVLDAVGLPHSRPRSALDIADAIDALRVSAESDDASAAVGARQRAERTLRVLLYYTLHTVGSNAFRDLIDNPGDLRLPRRLMKLKDLNHHGSALHQCEALKEDGWADLGFLTLAVRKLSKALEDAKCTGITGLPFSPLLQKEADAFLALGTALQAYAHDKPSLDVEKRQKLLDALSGLASAFSDLRLRNVFPDELLVTEVCDSVLGSVVHAIDSRGESVRLSVTARPTIGTRIYAIRSSTRPYSRCAWAPCPW
jgi:hypothetical protein